MSRTRRSKTFTCTNDCQFSGCPGHTMEVVWEHTSDTIDIRIDGESWYVMDDAKFYTMIQIAKERREQFEQEEARFQSQKAQ